MQKVLRNAILGPDPAAATAASSTQRGSAAKAVAVAGDQLAAPADGYGRDGRRGAVGAAVLRRVLFREECRGEGAFLIANPGDLSGEEHSYAGLLPDALERAGVEVVAFRAP